MAKCTVKLLTNADKNGFNRFVQVKDFVNENEKIDFTKLAKALLSATESRQAIINTLSNTSQVTLSKSDIETFNFQSNISVANLEDMADGFKGVYDPEGDDNTYILLRAKFKIADKIQHGRFVNKNGQEIFIINNQYDAAKFLKYAQARKLLSNFDKIKNENLSKDTLSKLENFAKEYGTKPQTLLRKYLDSEKLISGSKIFNGYRILHDAINELVDNYYENTNLTELELAVKNNSTFKKDSNNNNTWTIDMHVLYNIIANNIEDFKEKCPYSDFYKMSEEQVSELLIGKDAGILLGNPSFDSSKITVMGEQRNEKIVTKNVGEKNLKEVFDWMKTKDPSIKNITLNKYIKEHPNEFVEAYNSDDKDNPRFKYKYNDGEIVDSYASITDGKVKVTYDIDNNRDVIKKVVITNVYKKTSQIVDCRAGEKQTLFQPVGDIDEFNIVDSKYNGFYIYQFSINGKTRYGVYRNKFSKEAYVKECLNLEEVIKYINNAISKDKISDRALIDIRIDTGSKKRYVKLEPNYIDSGQVVSVMNRSIPDILLSTYLANYLDMTLPEFKAQMKKVNPAITNLDNINTYDEAVSFIYETQNYIEEKYPNEKNIEEIMADKEVGEALNNIINDIISDTNGTIDIYVEDIPKVRKNDNMNRGRYATVSVLKDAYAIDVSGNYSDGAYKDKSVSLHPTIVLNNFITHLKDVYNINIEAFNESQFKEFCKKIEEERGINLYKENTRGLIFDGTIYINTTNARLVDLHHELAHVFLGVIKARDPNAVQQFIGQYIMRKYQMNKKFMRVLDSLRKDSVYENLSENDLMEEATVRIIADNLDRDGSVFNEGNFNENEYNKQMENIINVLNSCMVQTDNGLSFNSLSDLVAATKEDGIKTTMMQNRIIANIIAQLKENSLIEEECE